MSLKNLAGLPATVIIVGCLSFLGLPWWMTAVGGALAGILFPLSAGTAFSTGFAAGFSLWYSVAAFFNFANNSVLATKMGEVFGGLKDWHLLTGTGALGGLLAGLGVLVGVYLKAIVKR